MVHGYLKKEAMNRDSQKISMNGTKHLKCRWGSILLIPWVATVISSSGGAELSSQQPSGNSTPGPATKLEAPAATIWKDAVGEGFLSTVHSFSVELGVGLGMAKLAGC